MRPVAALDRKRAPSRQNLPNQTRVCLLPTRCIARYVGSAYLAKQENGTISVFEEEQLPHAHVEARELGAVGRGRRRGPRPAGPRAPPGGRRRAPPGSRRRRAAARGSPSRGRRARAPRAPARSTAPAAEPHGEGHDPVAPVALGVGDVLEDRDRERERQHEHGQRPHGGRDRRAAVPSASEKCAETPRLTTTERTPETHSEASTGKRLSRSGRHRVRGADQRARRHRDRLQRRPG